MEKQKEAIELKEVQEEKAEVACAAPVCTCGNRSLVPIALLFAGSIPIIFALLKFWAAMAGVDLDLHEGALYFSLSNGIAAVLGYRVIKRKKD